MTALQLLKRVRARRLTLSQSTILLTLAEMPEGGRYIDVAHTSALSESGASVQIHRLHKIGLLAYDAERRRYRLSETGQKEVRAILSN